MTSTVDRAKATIPGQRRGMSIFGISRRFVLLLALAFAFSTLIHVAAGSHSAFAQDHGHAFVAASLGGDAACQPGGHHGHVKDKSCALGVNCALCVPVTMTAIAVSSAAEPFDVAAPNACLENTLAPQFRPPKLSLRS